MKIRVLTHDLNPKTGWGRYASGLVAGIKQAGHEVLVLKEEGEFDDGQVVIRRRFGILKSVLDVCRLAKDCDIIHALDVYPYGIIAWLASLFIGVRFMITAIGAYSIAPLYRPATGWFAKRALRNAATIIAISNFTKSQILKIDPTISIDTITPGIDTGHFYQEHAEVQSPYILGVGAIKNRKGYHVSIPAFAAAKKDIAHLRYVIVGNPEDKEYLQDLKDLAKKHGVGDSIEFKTGVSDEELLRLYREAKLFILTSINEGHHVEGFGLVFLEAAASGLPVIGTTGNGIADAIEDGKNGLLAPQGNISSTTDAIIKILTDDDLWQSMSKESYAWARAHDESKMIQKYLDAYDGLANK